MILRRFIFIIVPFFYSFKVMAVHDRKDSPTPSSPSPTISTLVFPSPTDTELLNDGPEETSRIEQIKKNPPYGIYYRDFLSYLDEGAYFKLDLFKSWYMKAYENQQGDVFSYPQQLLDALAREDNDDPVRNVHKVLLHENFEDFIVRIMDWYVPGEWEPRQMGKYTVISGIPHMTGLDCDDKEIEQYLNGWMYQMAREYIKKNVPLEDWFVWPDKDTYSKKYSKVLKAEKKRTRKYFTEEEKLARMPKKERDEVFRKRTLEFEAMNERIKRRYIEEDQRKEWLIETYLKDDYEYFEDEDLIDFLAREHKMCFDSYSELTEKYKIYRSDVSLMSDEYEKKQNSTQK